MKEKRLSIKDISAMSGVSVATVSRVINQSGRYSKDTEERVMSVIRATNYTPNMVAKGLRKKHMNNIGIVVPDITNEFFVSLVRSIEQALFASSYSTFVCNTNEDPEIERKQLHMLQTQSIAGLVYISGAGLPLAAGEIESIPTVFIDRLPPHGTLKGSYITIESDNTRGGYLATKHLLDAGCRQILLLTDHRRFSSQQERINGYLEAHSREGLVFHSRNIIDLPVISFDCARDTILRLLDEGRVFDGVFATTDWLAMGAYTALLSRGLEVPEQVRIVGYDDISIARYNAKPITTIHQQVDLIAKATAQGLLSLIDKKPVENRAISIPVYLVERSTT